MKRSSQLSIAAAFVTLGLSLAPVSNADVGLQIQPTPTPVYKPTVAPIATPVTSSNAAGSTKPAHAQQTQNDLQAKIGSILSRPELRRGMVGIKVVSLNSGKTVFEDNAEKY